MSEIIEQKIIKADFFQKLIIKLNAPSLAVKTNFFRLLALAENAGLGIREALISIKRSETNKWLLIIIDDLINQLTQGLPFSQALANHDYIFKPDEIALIQAAETIGNLPKVLGEIADELENTQRINQKIKKAATYPVILLIFAVIAVVILLIYVMPTVVGLFPTQESLPSITKFMLGISGFLKIYRFLLTAGIIGLVLLYKFSYRFVLPFKIVIDKIMIKLPAIWGVTKTFHMYRFSNLLGQLYGGGVSPVLTLQLLGNVFNNFHYKKKVLEIKEDLEAGFTFAESMQWSDLFDQILIQIIHVGEETGNISEVLKKMSYFYRDLLQTKIDILMSFLEPFMMAWIAVIIGMIVASIFLPMADLVNVIQ